MAMSISDRLARHLHLRSFGRLAVVAGAVVALIAVSIVVSQSPQRDNNVDVPPDVAAEGSPITDLPSDLQDVVNWDDNDNPVVAPDPGIVVETEDGFSTLETLNEGDN